VPGIKALSFVDDVAWVAEGAEKNEISEILERAAAAAQEWAEDNAVTFDTQKTEATLRTEQPKKTQGPRSTPSGNPGRRQEGPFQRPSDPMARSLARPAAHAERTHHDVRVKARNVQTRLRRLAGQVGLSPENCRKIQAGSCPVRRGALVEGQ